MNHEAREIRCQDCGEVFLFSVAEAEVFKNRGLTEPKRCKPCRLARREATQPIRVSYPTGDPNEYRSPMAGNFPTPQRAPEGDRRFDRSPRQPRARTMHTTICAQCGSTAHVPFEPSRGRQVLCRPCFDETRTGKQPAENETDSSQ